MRNKYTHMERSEETHDQPQPERRSILQKGAGLVASHSMVALALIVVLLVVVVYLYARQMGWFGLGPRPKKAKPSKSEEKDDEDPETSRLIESINKSSN